MHEWPQTRRGLPQLFYAHNGNNVVPMQGTYHPVTGMGVVVPLAYISEDLRMKEAEVKEEKKNVNKLRKQVEEQKQTHKKDLETETKKLRDKMKDQNELVGILKKQLKTAENGLQSLKESHADEVSHVFKSAENGIKSLKESHAEEKIRLMEENKRILEENQRLLLADERNKEQLTKWKEQREVLTHIMAGTIKVDPTELSKARNNISPFMNAAALQSDSMGGPALLQPAPPPPDVGTKRSCPQAPDGETQDDTQPAKKNSKTA